MKKQTIALIALSLLSATAFGADTSKPFSYRVKVPANTGSCEDHAHSIATFFASVTRGKSVSGTCQGRQTLVDQGKSYDIDVVVVSYLADYEQIPNHAVFGANEFLGDGSPTAGVFKTYADCLAELSTQGPIFTAETGLTPVAGYCTASTQPAYPGFSLTFDSFGEAKHKLYTYSEDGTGIYGQDNSQGLHAAQTAVQSAGGRIVWSDNFRLFYYNDYRISVSAENLGTFTEASQCSSQLAQARAIFVKAGLTGVTSYCQAQQATGTVIFTDLMAVGAGQNEVQDTASGRYDSFAECMSDLGRVIQNATSSGGAIYGGLCSPNLSGQDGFETHVFFAL